jgi:hypothetical protein
MTLWILYYRLSLLKRLDVQFASITENKNAPWILVDDAFFIIIQQF